jgi:hypothetical protein
MRPAVVKSNPALPITTMPRSGRKVTIVGKVSAKASGKVTIRHRVRSTARPTS